MAQVDAGGGGMSNPCQHLDQINDVLPSADGCEDCLAAGGKWLHLRICLECGHVGCCDSSPMRHASAHARESDHPIMRSLEPDEEWSWCFVDETGFVLPDVHGEPRIPPSPLAQEWGVG